MISVNRKRGSIPIRDSSCSTTYCHTNLLKITIASTEYDKVSVDFPIESYNSYTVPYCTSIYLFTPHLAQVLVMDRIPQWFCFVEKTSANPFDLGTNQLRRSHCGKHDHSLPKLRDGFKFKYSMWAWWPALPTAKMILSEEDHNYGLFFFSVI